MITSFAKFFAIIGTMPGKVKNFFTRKKGGPVAPLDRIKKKFFQQLLEAGIPSRSVMNGWKTMGLKG
jgi:hypothetical protein